MNELKTEQEYVELSARKRELKAELSQVTDQMAGLEGEILELFERGGVDRLTINGTTLYVHRQLWAHAKDGDKPRAVAALQAAGMDEFVTFNTQSVSALFREADRDKDAMIIPAEVRNAFETTENVGLRTRKGS